MALSNRLPTIWFIRFSSAYRGGRSASNRTSSLIPRDSATGPAASSNAFQKRFNRKLCAVEFDGPGLWLGGQSDIIYQASKSSNGLSHIDQKIVSQVGVLDGSLPKALDAQLHSRQRACQLVSYVSQESSGAFSIGFEVSPPSDLNNGINRAVRWDPPQGYADDSHPLQRWPPAPAHVKTGARSNS